MEQFKSNAAAPPGSERHAWRNYAGFGMLVGAAEQALKVWSEGSTFDFQAVEDVAVEMADRLLRQERARR